MLPILYSSIMSGSVPTDYGVGVLSDCISASVKEARNGEYELTMEYSADGIHASDIVPNAYLKVKPNYTDNPQLFRIYKVGKTINGRFTVNAQHLSYDLSGLAITSGTASSLGGAITLLNSNSGFFVLSTDKAVSGDFKITEPSSVRSWLGGKEGSILDLYGPGEWKYDNYTIKFMSARGADRGVTIRYGKNLTELSQVLDMTNLASGIIPFYKAQDGTITTGAEVATGWTGMTMVKCVDFTSSVDPESLTPIATQLATLATAYVSNNNFTTMKNNITLNFVQLQGLTERVDLCDTVHIYFEPLGLTATAKCIETVWDVLEERYTSTTFGDPKTNIADTIVATQKEVEQKPSVTSMDQAIKQATELITGNLGGYVILHDSNGDGEPDEILIMDTADIATATNVWRWNSGGLGFSPNGYGGPYNAVAIDMQGRIVADAITTGTLNADLIKAGTISDLQGNSTIDMTNGSAKMKDFKAVDSIDLLDGSNNIRASIRYSSTGESSFYVYNSSGNAVGAIQAHPLQGAMMGLSDLTGSVQTLKTGGNGNGGGWLEGKNYNDKRTFLLDGTVNGGSLLQICDADGNNDARFQLINKNGVIVGLLYTDNLGGTLELASNTYVNITCVGRTGKITCVSLTQTSSRKAKKNIKPIEDHMKILELDAVSFDYKDEERGTNKRGFIAEDVEKVLPNLVTPESDGMLASLDYVEMIPYLQAVIKDQEKRITELEKIIKEGK